MLSLLTLDIVHASMTLCSLNRNLDWLALEALFEQVAISRILVILYPCIIAVPYQGTLNLEDVLVVDASHHHMMDACA